MQNVTNKMNNFENYIKTQESTDMFEKIWPTIQDTLDNYLKPEEGTDNGKNITLLGKWIEEQIVKKYEILGKEQENILEKEPNVESSFEKEPKTPIIESPVVVFTPQKRKRTTNDVKTTKKVAIDEENTQTHSDQSETTDNEPFEKQKNTKKNTKKTKKIEKIEIKKNLKLVQKEKDSLKVLAIKICQSISTNKNPSTYENQEITRIENQIILKSNEDNIKIVFDNMILQDQYHVQQVSDAFDKQKNAIFHYYETLLKAYKSKENQIDFFRKHSDMAEKMLGETPIEDTQNEEKARGKVSLLLVNP
jgi:hypothetical protein